MWSADAITLASIALSECGAGVLASCVSDTHHANVKGGHDVIVAEIHVLQLAYTVTCVDRFAIHLRCSIVV